MGRRICFLGPLVIAGVVGCSQTASADEAAQPAIAILYHHTHPNNRGPSLRRNQRTMVHVASCRDSSDEGRHLGHRAGMRGSALRTQADGEPLVRSCLSIEESNERVVSRKTDPIET